MRKSSVAVTLTLLSPALIAGCASRDCDPRYENCSTTGGGRGYVGTSYRSTGSGVAGKASIGTTSRGGFGGFSGFHGFGG